MDTYFQCTATYRTEDNTVRIEKFAHAERSIVDAWFIEKAAKVAGAVAAVVANTETLTHNTKDEVWLTLEQIKNGRAATLFKITLVSQIF